MCKLFGSNAGKHKVDILSYTTGNLTPKLQSKRCAIGLLAIANAQLIKIYGFEPILRPFLDDLNSPLFSFHFQSMVRKYKVSL